VTRGLSFVRFRAPLQCSDCDGGETQILMVVIILLKQKQIEQQQQNRLMLIISSMQATAKESRRSYWFKLC
jgi:hypothetical protein